MVRLETFFIVFALTMYLVKPLEAQSGNTEGEAEKSESVKGPSYVITVEESLPEKAEESAFFTKSPLPILETPASVSVVPQSLFKSQDGVILSDTLKNVPGVNIQTGFGVHDLFVVRGLDSLSSGLVLTDGAAEPEATFYDLYNVDQVEVLRGPLGFLYGGNSIFGAVNLKRKQPLVGQQFLQASYRLGSFDPVRVQFDFNRSSPGSSVAFRFNAMGQFSEGYRSKPSYQGAVNPAFRWDLNERTTMTVNLEYVVNEFEPDAGIPVIKDRITQVPRRTSYGSDHDDSAQEIFRFRLDLESSLTDWFKIRSKIYHTDLEWISDGTLITGVLPAPSIAIFPPIPSPLEVHRVLNSLDNRQRLLGAQFETIFQFATGAISHNLMVGIEISRMTDRFSLDVFHLPALPLVNPDPHVDPYNNIFPIQGQYQEGNVSSVIWSPYIIDHFQPLEFLQFFAGGRFDVLEYREKVSSTHRKETQFNPIVAAVFQPMEKGFVYVSAGTAFGTPSTLVVGPRQPEESRQIEGGFKKELFGGNLRAELSIYNLRKSNIAIPDQSGVTRQLGVQDSQGIEVALSAQLSDLWYLSGNYSLNRSILNSFSESVMTGINPVTYATLDRSNNFAPFAPQHIFNLWTHKEFSNRLGVAWGPRYVSGQFIAADNLFEMEDYWTMDAVLSYRLHNWQVRLNFKNLTGADYEVRGFGSSSVIPADGATVFATIQFTR